jgi:hypothetical protein
MKKATLILFGLLLLLLPSSAFAQLTTASSINVSVSVTVSSSISLSQSGGTLTFNNTSGQTNAITFTSSWSLGPTSQLHLYTWFSSPTSALSTGPSNIPASSIAATFTTPGTSGSGTPCTQAPGAGSGVVDGAACQPIDMSRGADGPQLNPAGNNIGSMNITYSLAFLNYSTLQTSIAAGVYTGTLNALVISI